MQAINMQAKTFEEVEAIIRTLESMSAADAIAAVNAVSKIRHTSKPAALKRLRERLERHVDRMRPVNGLDCMCG